MEVGQSGAAGPFVQQAVVVVLRLEQECVQILHLHTEVMTAPESGKKVNNVTNMCHAMVSTRVSDSEHHSQLTCYHSNISI